MKKPITPWNVLRQALLIFFAAVVLFPLLWVFFASFQGRKLSLFHF